MFSTKGSELKNIFSGWLGENVYRKHKLETSWILRGINKLPDKWNEVTKNNVEYTNDWN